jgi:hypothetical protein
MIALRIKSYVLRWPSQFWVVLAQFWDFLSLNKKRMWKHRICVVTGVNRMYCRSMDCSEASKTSRSERQE